MKTILLVSSRIITSADVIQKLESFFNRFEVAHLFLEEGAEEIPENINGVVFNNDTDSQEIGRIKDRFPKDIPKIRVYSAFWGYDEMDDVAVRQTMQEVSSYLEQTLLN